MKLRYCIECLVALLLLVATPMEAHHWVNKLPGYSYSVAYNPRNTQTIYAGQGLTLSVSYNAGETWSTLTSFNDPADGIRFITIHPVDTTIMFAGAVQLWGTTNAGMTWVKVIDGVLYDGESLIVDWQSPNRVYTAGLLGGFRRSTDGGVTWAITPGT